MSDTSKEQVPGAYLISGYPFWFDALHDADSLNDQAHALWWSLHGSNLYNVVLVQGFQALQGGVLATVGITGMSYFTLMQCATNICVCVHLALHKEIFICIHLYKLCQFAVYPYSFVVYYVCFFLVSYVCFFLVYYVCFFLFYYVWVFSLSIMSVSFFVVSLSLSLVTF